MKDKISQITNPQSEKEKEKNYKKKKSIKMRNRSDGGNNSIKKCSNY